MLNKKTCRKCYQKNEKIWDEELWRDGFIDCPKEELDMRFKGKEIREESRYYNFFMNIYSARTINEIPNHCPYDHI
jgi:hypothetical protein